MANKRGLPRKIITSGDNGNSGLENGLVKDKDGKYITQDTRYKELKDKSYDTTRGKGAFIKDPEALLKQYEPLIKHVIKKYGTASKFKSDRDRKDFRIGVIEEFLTLVDEFNPYLGVDFPGYIKFKFDRRIKSCYVNKHIKDINREGPLRGDGEVDYTVADLIDKRHEEGKSNYFSGKDRRKESGFKVFSEVTAVNQDTDYLERIDDIRRWVPMDLVDELVFSAFQNGLSSYIDIYSYIYNIIKDKDITLSKSEIHSHVDSLRNKLAMYYQGAPVDELSNIKHTRS